MQQIKGSLWEQVRSPVRDTSGGAQIQHQGALCEGLTVSGVGGQLQKPLCLSDCWLVHACFPEKNSVPLTPDPSDFTALRSLLSPFPSGCGSEGQALHGWSQETGPVRPRFPSFSPARAIFTELVMLKPILSNIFLELNQLPVLCQ